MIGCGGSCERVVGKMFTTWAESRAIHLALYRDRDSGVFYFWVHDSQQEGRFLGGRKSVDLIFCGGYWEFMRRVVKVVGEYMRRNLDECLPKDF